MNDGHSLYSLVFGTKGQFPTVEELPGLGKEGDQGCETRTSEDRSVPPLVIQGHRASRLTGADETVQNRYVVGNTVALPEPNW